MPRQVYAAPYTVSGLPLRLFARTRRKASASSSYCIAVTSSRAPERDLRACCTLATLSRRPQVVLAGRHALNDVYHPRSEYRPASPSPFCLGDSLLHGSCYQTGRRGA
jgi:hypothetical protein